MGRRRREIVDEEAEAEEAGRRIVVDETGWVEEREFARTPVGRFECRQRCLDRRWYAYLAEVRKMEEFLRQYPKSRYPELWEAMPEELRRMLARRSQKRAQQTHPQPRLVVNNVIPVTRPQPLKRERLDDDGPDEAA